MLTQQQIANDYTLSASGVIQNPGKFEGEAWQTVAMADLALNGGSDETLQWGEDESEDIFFLDDKLRAMLNCDAREYAYSLYYNLQGFVYGQTIDRDTYESRLKENEKQIEEAWSGED